MTPALVVSGKSFDAACDPSASDVPREEGWPEPEHRRRGKGWQCVYPPSLDLARLIESHMRTVGEGFMYAGPDDPETRAEGRALLRDADRLRRDWALG